MAADEMICGHRRAACPGWPAGKPIAKDRPYPSILTALRLSFFDTVSDCEEGCALTIHNETTLSMTGEGCFVLGVFATRVRIFGWAAPECEGGTHDRTIKTAKGLCGFSISARDSMNEAGSRTVAIKTEA
jgi:hypothetical protein